MSSLSKIVDSLELKINVLLKKYHNANRSNESLKEQFEDLKNENTELQSVLESQNQEIKMLKTANALLGSND